MKLGLFCFCQSRWINAFVVRVCLQDWDEITGIGFEMGLWPFKGLLRFVDLSSGLFCG